MKKCVGEEKRLMFNVINEKAISSLKMKKAMAPAGYCPLRARGNTPVKVFKDLDGSIIADIENKSIFE